MSKYTVKIPDGAARWGIALAESISKWFNILSAEMKDTNNSLSADIKETNSKLQTIDNKFDKLSNQIMAEVKQVSDIAKEAMNIAVAAQASCDEMAAKVIKLEKNVFKLTVQNKGLQEENSHLNKRTDNQESYSRRENLVIRGINEMERDDDDTCSQLARKFFVNQLNISEECVNNMAFVRCHRLGKRPHYGKRPVIVRFQSYADRQMVWSKRIHLKNKAFSLHENYANEVEYRRRLMYPILAEAKKSGKYNRIYLNGDVLRIDGSDYTVDDLNRLPDDLHPSRFSRKENDDCIIFGGIHSSFNFLSNFYCSSVAYNGIEFDDVERAYQYSKAVKFNDCNTSERIICSRSPSAAKRLGASVKNFNTQDWDNVKEEIMLEILRIKFAPNTDLAAKLTATAQKTIAEAGQSTTYSIGMSLNHKDLFKTEKWSKNVLGKLLMKVREELI